MSIEANKAVIRAFVESWNSGDFERLGNLVDEACTLTVSGQTMSMGPSSTRQIAEYWRSAFPDWRFELLDLIAEGEKVVAYMPYTGTQTGPALDIPATGRKVRVSEIVIFRVVGGKIVEAWEVYDEYWMRRQLGVLPGAPTDASSYEW
jgi:predicted ester cyclase